MIAVYVIWCDRRGLPELHGTLTEIGLEDGSTTPGMPVVQLVGLVATRPGRR